MPPICPFYNPAHRTLCQAFPHFSPKSQPCPPLDYHGVLYMSPSLLCGHYAKLTIYLSTSPSRLGAPGEQFYVLFFSVCLAYNRDSVNVC